MTPKQPSHFATLISRAGLDANFADVLAVARRALTHRVFQLGESHDMAGQSHQARVQALAASWRAHFDAMERELEELP